MVSENKEDLQQKVEDVSFAASLNNRIRNSEGYPVYIVDDHDSIMKLFLTDKVIFENIFDVKKLASDKKDLEIFFSTTKQKKDTDSPVIFLVKSRSKDVLTVMNTLNASCIEVFYQDANYSFTGITTNNRAEIREEIRRQYQKNFSTAAVIDSFKDVINSTANTPPIPTGFDSLDKILNGGLHEGLISIGAMTSLGKTTFCMQIADHIAQSGHDVMIFSLEMSKNELISKSISRITYENAIARKLPLSNAKTQLGITDGSRYSKYSETEKILINEAISEYKNKVAQHLFIYESVADMTVNQIKDIIQNHYENNKELPVVVIDYLQLLQHEDKYINSNDKLRTDVNITSLKRISRDYKIPILVISSFNRTSYDKDITLSAFKESGGIEYSSDIIIGLQQTSEQPIKQSELTERIIKLSVLKNRQGVKGKEIEYRYQAAFNHYEESNIVSNRKKYDFTD